MSAKPQMKPVSIAAERVARRVTPDPAIRYYVFRWKRQLDQGTHLAKKLFFWLIYRPFNQFCRFVLHLPTFNAEECCGCRKRLLWTEHENIQREEWQAIQACKTRDWGFHALLYETETSGASLTETINHNYPMTDAKAQARYEANRIPKIEVERPEMVKLASTVRRTDGLVAQFQAKTT